MLNYQRVGSFQNTVLWGSVMTCEVPQGAQQIPLPRGLPTGAGRYGDAGSHGALINDIPSQVKPLFSLGIFEATMFDDTRG